MGTFSKGDQQDKAWRESTALKGPALTPVNQLRKNLMLLRMLMKIHHQWLLLQKLMKCASFSSKTNAGLGTNAEIDMKENRFKKLQPNPNQNKKNHARLNMKKIKRSHQ